MNSLVTSTLLTAVVVAVLAQGADRSVADKVMKLTRDSTWTRVASIPIAFRTFHPQGMVKIGDTFYVSSVEVTKPTTRFATPVEGKDRDAGAGVGHLFKIDRTGTLVADVRLGEDTIYHPGGIDYDGKNLWVPVAEYRPNSRSIVYRVDPGALRATEVFRFSDHIGAIVHDTDRQMLAGVSWGSRRFYRWPLTRDGRVTDARRRSGEAGHAEPVALRRLSGLQVRRNAAGCSVPASRNCAADPALDRSGLAAWISSISPTAVRAIRCRSCCGPTTVWT